MSLTQIYTCDVCGEGINKGQFHYIRPRAISLEKPVTLIQRDVCRSCYKRLEKLLIAKNAGVSWLLDGFESYKCVEAMQ